MPGTSPRGAIVYASGMEDRTISRQFSPDEKGTLLEYVLDSVWTVTDELTVVFQNDPELSMIEAISPFGAKIVNASVGDNPLSTVLSAFESSKAEHCILVTEKVPLLKPNVAIALFEAAHGLDLAIPKWNDGHTDPLLAVYRGKALLRLSATLDPRLDKDVAVGMETLSDQLFDVKYVPVEKDLKELDPELDSFLKVENEATLIQAQARASAKGSKPKKAG